MHPIRHRKGVSGNRRTNALGGLHCRVPLGLRQDGQEFLTPQPPQNVDAAQRAPCDRSHLVERAIAGAEVIEATRALARRVARGPTGAFMASKRILRNGPPERFSLEEVLAQEAEAQATAAAGHDFGEGVMAFLEKRKPNYLGK